MLEQAAEGPSAIGKSFLTTVPQIGKVGLLANNAEYRTQTKEQDFLLLSAHNRLSRSSRRIPLLSRLRHIAPGSACRLDIGEPPRRLIGTCKVDVLSADPTAPLVCVCVSAVLKVQFPLINGKTSPLTCHSGCPPEQSCRSALNARCPRSRNALQTSCDSSQAIRTFI